MPPKIIGLVGPIRAGKTFVAKHLQEKHGYQPASNSDILREIAKNLGFTQNRDNLKKLGDSIFSVLGNDTIARFRIANVGNSHIVVDGIRYKEEVDIYLQEPSFRLLGVIAPEHTRYDRAVALANEGKDQAISRESFSQLCFARSEYQVEALLTRADAIIKNNSSIESLKLAIDQIISKWS